MTNVHLSFTKAGYNKALEITSAIELMGGKARLGQTWQDYGAGISWETILIHSNSLDMEYQALSPRDFEDINKGSLSIERIQEIINNAVKR